MSTEKDSCYEFGGFTLIPDDKLVLHLNKPVDLIGKDFEILHYLVSHPNAFISTSKLVDAVWGSASTIRDGNVTNHIAKIRKALGCDSRKPKFIKTVYGKEGYRFIAPVMHSDNMSQISFPPTKSDEFQVTFHLFVPVFLGSKSYKRMNIHPTRTRWLDYKEFRIDSGRLCVLPTGFAVWHLTETSRFPNLTAVASRRRERYHEILHAKTAVSICTIELVDRDDRDDAFRSFLGQFGYVFSLMTLLKLRRINQLVLRNILEILSCPTILEATEETANGKLDLSLERRFVEDGTKSSDPKEFGLSGRDKGFASWNGVSYYKFTKASPDSVKEIVEFELAVQATWWHCKCLSDILLLNKKTNKKELRQSVLDITIQYAKLKNIVATETASQRTMAEAILTTSRLGPLVEETFKLFSRL